MPGSDSASPSEPDEAASTRAPEKNRIRASVACNSCRLRRSKCIIKPKQTDCEQCRRGKLACVFEDDNRRKRRRPKANLSHVTEQLALIESLLKDHRRSDERSQSSIVEVNDNNKDVDNNQSPLEVHESINALPRQHCAPGSVDIPRKSINTIATDNDLVVQKSMDVPPPDGQSSDPHVHVSPINHRPGSSSFGAAATHTSTSIQNASAFAEASVPTVQWNLEVPQAPEQAESLVSSEAEQALFDLFWLHYNPVFRFVNRYDFLRARQRKSSDHYSRGLHFCILAIGLRFADKSLGIISHLAGDVSAQSKLHRAAKAAVEEELEYASALTNAQALMLLSDLECGIGKYSKGQMYTSMACRLALNLISGSDRAKAGASPPYPSVLQPLLYAGLVFESYWDLILTGSPFVKATDVKILKFAATFSIMGAEMHSAIVNESQVSDFTALLELASYVGHTAETHTYNTSIKHKDMLRVLMLDHDLSNWYDNLPSPVQWNDLNAEFGASSFFLFHQHYHACIILLHRPFAGTTRRSLFLENDGGAISPVQCPDRVTRLSRETCFEHASRLVEVLVSHHNRFNGRNMAFMALNHADVAATSLIDVLKSVGSRQTHISAMLRLQELLKVINALSITYPKASNLSTAIEAERDAWKHIQSSATRATSTDFHMPAPGQPEGVSFPTSRHMNHQGMLPADHDDVSMLYLPHELDDTNMGDATLDDIHHQIHSLPYIEPGSGVLANLASVGEGTCRLERNEDRNQQDVWDTIFEGDLHNSVSF